MEFSPPLSPAAGPGGTPKISRATLFGLGQQAPAAASAENIRQLRGVVRSGVEHNSQVLVGPQGQVLAQLIGGPPAVLAEGRQVVVTGVFVRDLLTTAQQGVPFQVQTAEPDDQPG